MKKPAGLSVDRATIFFYARRVERKGCSPTNSFILA